MKTKNLKLRSKKRKVMSADELMAYKQAYERELNGKDYLVLVGMPALVLGGITYYLTYHFILTGIAVILGTIYGRIFCMPKAIYRNYQIRSLRERNRFVNLVTQTMSDPEKIPPIILERVLTCLGGELKTDFEPMLTKLSGSPDTKEIHCEFLKITQKYRTDLIFCQFLEQLETNFLAGIDNLSTLQDISDYHNQLLKKRDSFLKFKTEQKTNLVMLSMIILFLITTLEFGFGHFEFLNDYIKNPIGLLTSVIYLLVNGLIVHRFFTKYYDDVITEVKVK